MQQELKEREEVERELGLVKTWIQDTCGLLHSPTADVDSLLQELEVITAVSDRNSLLSELSLSASSSPLSVSAPSYSS